MNKFLLITIFMVIGLVSISGGVIYDAKDLQWEKMFDDSLNIIATDIGTLNNITEPSTELGTNLEMIWHDIGEQGTWLKNNPAPKNFQDVEYDYIRVLGSLQSAVLNLEDFNTYTNKPITKIGSNLRQIGLQTPQSKLEAGNENLKEAKKYVLRIVTVDIDFKQIYGD